MSLSPRKIRPHSSLPALTLGGALALTLLAVPASADPDGRRDHRYEERRHHERRHHSEHRYDDRRHRYDHRYDRHRGKHRGRYDDRYDYRYRERYRYRAPYRYGSYERRHRHFEVPRVIHDQRAWERYSYDRVYYRGHRHYHRIYRFPVYTAYGVHYEPYAYCEGRYFSQGAFYYDGPRLSIRWRF